MLLDTEPELDELDEPELAIELTSELLTDLWATWRRAHYTKVPYYNQHDAFESYLTSSGYTWDALLWCPSCNDPGLDDEDWTATVEGLVCTDCDTYYCEGCYDTFTAETRTINDEQYCESCAEPWEYCDECDYYYTSDDEDHSHSCSCEAPAQTFAVRNDGEPLLFNDTRTTVTLPAGIIDAEGLRRIRKLLYEHCIYVNNTDLGETIGPAWQTRQGNFTKRLSRFVYKANTGKISPEVLSAVGCIAREHSTNTSEHGIEVTRDLNLPAEDFFHDESCWWGSYSGSRCALKSNGGFGLRTFDDYGSVEGRAWVLPLKYAGTSFKPTFDTVAPDAFVVFNGYGNLDGYTPARIVAHMAGMTYRKIDFQAYSMYINNGGYLVAPEEIASEVTAISLSLTEHAHLYGQEN
jgi:hypothetical protein